MNEMEPILIRAGALAEIQSHAVGEYPLECCGLLWGRGKVIEGVVRTRNVRRSGKEFEIAPRELIDFMKAIRGDSRDFLGIYHSHPGGPAVPSAKDAAEFHYRETSYWIVSLQDGQAETRCYRWAEDGFRWAPHRRLD